jgi:hypothetical protein
MTGVDYADILNYGGEMETSATGWARLLAGVEESASYLQANAIAPTGQVWTGTAAQLASDRFVQAQGGLIANASSWKSIQQVLAGFDAAMLTSQRSLKLLVSDIENGGTWNGISIPANTFVVSQDGQVSYATGYHGPQDPSLVAQLQAQIQDIVNQADTEDSNTATQLAQYFPKAEFSQQGVTTDQWTTVSAYGSLWQIAQTEYGNGNMWTTIWQANAATFAAHGITDPNVIPVGMQLVVPSLSSNPAQLAVDPQPGQGA